MELERSVFGYLASEELCSRAEIEAAVKLRDGSEYEAAALIGRWQANGWLESVPQGETGLPDLLRLTDQAYAAHPWLQRAT